jgi:hypothetical protein
MIVSTNSDVHQVIERLNVKDSLSASMNTINAHNISQLLVKVTIVYLQRNPGKNR